MSYTIKVTDADIDRSMEGARQIRFKDVYIPIRAIELLSMAIFDSDPDANFTATIIFDAVVEFGILSTFT
jgi:hypothetical protein